MSEIITSIEELEDVLDQSENWTIEQLNDEQDSVKLSLLKPSDLKQDNTSEGFIKMPLSDVMLLQIEYGSPDKRLVFGFGKMPNGRMIRTSAIQSYNSVLKHIVTENSIYEVKSFTDSLHSARSVWTHLIYLGVSRFWPNRPQSLFF